MKRIMAVVVKRNGDYVDFEALDLIVLNPDEEKVLGEVLQAKGFDRVST